MHSRHSRDLVALAVSVLTVFTGACSTERTASNSKASAISSRRMQDGRQWTTENLSVASGDSYCYDNAEKNCRTYGRLYSWDSAQHACASLGSGWRLPTDAEWRQLAKAYGGVSADADDGGTAAYRALINGGNAGFNALLGGDRENGRFDRLDAHGFYWTSSDTNRDSAPFYNFGQGGLALHRQGEGAKEMAASVRCISDVTH